MKDTQSISEASKETKVKGDTLPKQLFPVFAQK